MSKRGEEEAAESSKREDGENQSRIVQTHQQQKPLLYLIICNIQSFNNVRALLMTGLAFGCDEILLVGRQIQQQQRQQCDNNDSIKGNKKNNNRLPKDFEYAMQKGMIRLSQFPKYRDLLQYLQQEKIHVVGIEIDERSHVLDDSYELPTKPKIAVFMGNEGQGIHPNHLKSCHDLIRIPQYGVGTASLNVNVAASIVLHRFHHLIRKQQQTSDTHDRKEEKS